MPTIWVDADACPNMIREVLFRAAQRVQMPMILVANQPQRTPPGNLIRAIQVPGGFDEADDYIAEQVAAGDLVITADIPLAARTIEVGAAALNPRGELYTPDNISQRLTMRNFMEEMRGAGLASGGPPPMDGKDKQTFSNALDRWITQARANTRG
ncbi:MAG: YaiI/YqxD family protein [Alcanivorax sp.]|nr:YaiI/YqxD family protein [Alcanivorax sp.]